MNWPAIFLVGVAFVLVCPAVVLRIARALRAVYDREDASLKAQRTPHMGDPRAVPELDLSPFDPARRRAVVAETWERREAEARDWCPVCRAEGER